jgi:hypothetical protein
MMFSGCIISFAAQKQAANGGFELRTFLYRAANLTVSKNTNIGAAV